MKIVRCRCAILFLFFLASVTIIGIVKKDREFSENENRYLSELPSFSWEQILSGKYQEQLESYLNDQIAGRDNWITIKTAVQKAMGNTDIGGAYVGKNGYDFEKITPEDVNEDLVERNVETVQAFFDSCAETLPKEKLCFLLVPTSAYVLEEQLPNNVRLFEQQKYLDMAKNATKEYAYIDVSAVLKEHSSEYLYYKTDHHWTMDGAYLSYEKWCEVTGRDFVPKEDKRKETVTKKFRGSLYSKILDADSAYDSIWVYKDAKEEASPNRFSVTIDEKKEGQMFDASRLEEKDKYKYFFGDNYGQVHIQNTLPSEDAQGSLLVIKDSFANTFVPLVAEEFAHVYMLDLRYYRGDVQEYIKEHEISEVLILYNISNFISDKNIFRLNERG